MVCKAEPFRKLMKVENMRVWDPRKKTSIPKPAFLSPLSVQNRTHFALKSTGFEI